LEAGRTAIRLAIPSEETVTSLEKSLLRRGEKKNLKGKSCRLSTAEKRPLRESNITPRRGSRSNGGGVKKRGGVSLSNLSGRGKVCEGRHHVSPREGMNPLLLPGRKDKGKSYQPYSLLD